MLLDGSRRRIESSYPCIYRIASESGSKGRDGSVEGKKEVRRGNKVGGRDNIVFYCLGGGEEVGYSDENLPEM